MPAAPPRDGPWQSPTSGHGARSAAPWPPLAQAKRGGRTTRLAHAKGLDPPLSNFDPDIVASDHDS